MEDVRGRIAGALYGVAIGDALGAPLEFMSKEEIYRKHGRVTEMIGGGWLNVMPGEVTDDYREIPERWIQALDPKIRKQLDRLVDAAVKNREASC